MKDTELKVTNYSELFNQIEQDIKSKLPDRSRGLIQEFVGYRHVELKEKERIGSEKAIEVKNALQIIQRNAEKIPNFLCTPNERREMSLDITEQVERIDSLLPQVNFKNEEDCPVCHGAGATTDHHDPCTECGGSGKVGGED